MNVSSPHSVGRLHPSTSRPALKRRGFGTGSTSCGPRGRLCAFENRWAGRFWVGTFRFSTVCGSGRGDARAVATEDEVNLVEDTGVSVSAIARYVRLTPWGRGSGEGAAAWLNSAMWSHTSRQWP